MKKKQPEPPSAAMSLALANLAAAEAVVVALSGESGEARNEVLLKVTNGTIKKADLRRALGYPVKQTFNNHLIPLRKENDDFGKEWAYFEKLQAVPKRVAETICRHFKGSDTVIAYTYQRPE